MDLGKLDPKAVDSKLKRTAVQTKSSGFRLTERDVELLGFLLDQKFASLEQVYFRFFDVRSKKLLTSIGRPSTVIRRLMH